MPRGWGSSRGCAPRVRVRIRVRVRVSLGLHAFEQQLEAEQLQLDDLLVMQAKP